MAIRAFNPRTPVYPVPGTLLTVPMHRHDRIVEVDDHPSFGSAGQRCPFGQATQESGGDRVELADMPEGERPQERAQRRRRVRAVEHRGHGAVPQQRHVVDAVGAGDHARDQCGYLPPRIGALVGRHRHVLVRQISEPVFLGQPQHRNQAGRGEEVAVIEHRRPYRAGMG